MGTIDFKEQVAECVGLWLAEGSTTSKSEITFTNNCLELIDLFSKTINKLFKNYSFNQRIYVYSNDGRIVNLPYKNCVYKYYFHKRATKPYFIFRIASVKLIKQWNEIIQENLNKKELYPAILKGFFAGEGNVKSGKKSVRVLRISQAVQKEFIDKMLNELHISYNFTSNNRMYNISGKENWDIFAKYNLANLHPNKKEKFWELFNSYKEIHYKNHYLYNEIYKILETPLTTKQLSEIFKRSFARIQDILILLKKNNKIKDFRIGSINYWTNDKELIIISKIKQKYLLSLNAPKKTSEITKEFKVSWKSSFKRLDELKKLGLVEIDENKKWKKKKITKKILII
jgi:hypothetical protein